MGRGYSIEPKCRARGENMLKVFHRTPGSNGHLQEFFVSIFHGYSLLLTTLVVRQPHRSAKRPRWALVVPTQHVRRACAIRKSTPRRFSL
eukprot:scaffold38142_cov27-Tisochrysis_lutea.AAC.1